MARVRAKLQPSGCINGHVWPEVGEEFDSTDFGVSDEAASELSHLWEPVKAPAKVEKRPAAKAAEEKR